MFSQHVLLGAVVVLAVIGLALLYSELRNVRKKEAMWLSSRKPNRFVPRDSRSQEQRA